MRVAHGVIAVAAVTAVGCSAADSGGAPSVSAKPVASATLTASSPAPRAATCTLPSSPDLLVRTIAPRVGPSAEILGSANLGLCIPTVQWLQQTTPTGPGYCTQVALSSDNPGYDLNRTPAPPLRKLIAKFGAGC